MPVDRRPVRATLALRLALRWARRHPEFAGERATVIVHILIAKLFFGEKYKDYLPDSDRRVHAGVNVPKRYRLDTRIYQELERRAKLIGDSKDAYFSAILLAELLEMGFDLKAAVLSLLPDASKLLGLEAAGRNVYDLSFWDLVVEVLVAPRTLFRPLAPLGEVIPAYRGPGLRPSA